MEQIFETLFDVGECGLTKVHILKNMSQSVLNSDIKYIPAAVADEMSENILFDLYHTYINGFRFFIYLDTKGKEEKFTFEDLWQLYHNHVSTEQVKENVERLLDIFLDVGLMSAEWEKNKRDNCWERVFRVRNEIAKAVKEYLQEDDAFNRYFLLYDLYYRYKNFNFVSEVLKINSYLAHIGDVIDLDHPKFYINFKNPVSYKNICEILREISNDSIYVPNIKYYHWGNTRITIYGLENWLNTQDEKCKLTQTKIRTILFISDIKNEEDLLIDSICFAPVVNMRLWKHKCNKEACKLFDEILCRLFEEANLPDNEKERECLYCFEFNLVLRLAKKFLDEFLNKIEMKYNIVFDGWKFYENRYGSKSIKKIIEEYFKQYNIKCDKKDDRSFEKFEKFEKLVLSKALIKIGLLEIDLCDWLCRDIFDEEFKPDTIIAIARKGVIIINHLLETEVYKYFEQKKRELGVNAEEINKLFNDFKKYMKGIKIMDDDEFICKLNRKEISLPTLGNILIFDDAIDEGNKISLFLEKVSKILKNEDWNRFKEKTKISAYIVNYRNRQKIYEKLRQFDFTPEDCFFCLYR